MTIRIDLFADIACPWCYIGERRLERALSGQPGLDVAWHWHPFQLQPDMPSEGRSWEDFVETKFGGAERADAMFRNVAAIGEEEELELRFDMVASAPNTRDAHRLVLLAELSGRGAAMAMALFRAYFSEGRNLNDLDTLVMIGRSVGLDEAELRVYLESETGADEVRASQEDAEKLGIGGVPFFIFNGRYAISGAQPFEMFQRVLEKLAEEEK